ncbi:U-box domain-containing protein 12 isoform X1 [Capsella rubella]|uniref:U-box domain-containing protein 12 isoform X1 n=2 Tax=Capsella rubella TaxID=81985 RepID=UPI000CD4DE8F|nr:U-box domain-containing protein 12 isoform X1 [Capsella rubella]
MAKSEKHKLAKTLIDSVNEIVSISDHRAPMKKHCSNLSRRLKLLLPMLEEIRDCKESTIPVAALLSLKDSLVPAKDLIAFVSQVSKIYLVLERDQVMVKFQKVTALLEQALSGIPYENLEISDELKEQVELVLVQLRREIGRGGDAYDDELYRDILFLYSDTGSVADSNVLRRVAVKLQLMTITDLTQESLALLDMVSSSGGDPGKSFEKMSMVLKKIKYFVQTDNPNLDDAPMRLKSPVPKLQDGDPNLPIPPEDLRCPISLELMTDPVIVSSGQTYERECISKWLEGGHLTCPKTQEKLTSDTVTPNYALRSLIAQWCESNGIEPPKRPNNTQPNSKASSSSSSTPADEHNQIEELLIKLTSQNPEDQRSAAGEIRLLAKQNNRNRVAIAASGAIPLLVNLLTISNDSRIQEHAVTSILNLSICQENKGRIVYSCGAVPGIVHVLQKGSMEARENAAATLFSLSVIDENKVTIGAAGAIPPLVILLSEGSQRGKKDAATALFNLCIFQGNKGKAVRAGLVPVLMRLLTETSSGMVDEALAILAIISSHPDGKTVVGAADAVHVMVEFIRSGSPRNKENAAAVLVHLCSWDQQHLVEAQKLGIMSLLIEMAENGTDRGKRKAAQLLNRFSRLNDQQKQSGVGVEDQISLI